MSSLAAGADPYWVKRLTNFYAKYNPEKLSSVNATVIKYQGYEMKLFQKLIEKYGPEPEDGANEKDINKDDVNDDDEKEEDSGSGSEEEEEDDADLGAMAELDQSDWPVDVPFCPSCGLPFEYCEYSMTARFSDCLPHLLEARPNMMFQKKGMTVRTFCDESGAKKEERSSAG